MNEASQEISEPLFDFSNFYQNDFLADCSLLIKDSNGTLNSTIRAHKIVLANSSDYFLDMFTSGMKESVTNEVDIRISNEIEIQLFPQIINYIYTGEIDISLDSFIPILHMARKYRIKQLFEELINYLDTNLTANDIIPLITQCYDLQFSSELELFDKYIIKFFNSIPISVLSDALDVNTFCRIIQKMNISDIEKRIDIINQFISSYEPNDDERNVLLNTLMPIDQKMKSVVKNKNITWLPIKFLNTCK